MISLIDKNNNSNINEGEKKNDIDLKINDLNKEQIKKDEQKKEKIEKKKQQKNIKINK